MTEEVKQKKDTDNFIIELKLITNDNQHQLLEKRFAIAEKIYNKILAHGNKQLKRMQENKEYKRTLLTYQEYVALGDKVNIKLYKDKLKETREFYLLSKNDFEKFAKIQQHMYKKHLDSNTVQKIAATVWGAISDLLFKKGKKTHFKKYGQLTSLEGKKNTTGIRFKNDKLEWNNLIIPVKIRDNDLFLQEALLKGVKYCRIIRKPFKSGNKCFLQLIIGGIPPAKRVNSTGEFRHKEALKGRVGLDIGTSSIAIASESSVKLVELAPNSTKYDREINNLKRKLQRSRIATNPDNFNENGNVKRNTKTNKLKWVRSNSYMKTLFKLKNAYRLKTNYVKISHNTLSNEIVSLGDKVYVEKMNFAGLAKRANKTTVNDKTGKFNKKKRFGKSVSNKSPALLIEIIDKKLKYSKNKINKINTWTFKASQYNHVTDDYIKKELSERWNIIDGKKVQRDLYSAFLLMNSKTDLQATNKSLCKKTYDNFLKNHDACISNIKSNKAIKLVSSFGI